MTHRSPNFFAGIVYQWHLLFLPILSWGAKLDSQNTLLTTSVKAFVLCCCEISFEFTSTTTNVDNNNQKLNWLNVSIFCKLQLLDKPSCHIIKLLFRFVPDSVFEYDSTNTETSILSSNSYRFWFRVFNCPSSSIPTLESHLLIHSFTVLNSDKTSSTSP